MPDKPRVLSPEEKTLDSKGILVRKGSTFYWGQIWGIKPHEEVRLLGGKIEEIYELR